MDVKQGCLLCPFLFCQLINYIIYDLGGEVLVGDYKLKLLAYAVDVVLLASHSLVLQFDWLIDMIDHLDHIVIYGILDKI